MRREFGSGKAVWERSEASILSNVVIARRPKYVREQKTGNEHREEFKIV
jgi:hypothetical protein